MAVERDEILGALRVKPALLSREGVDVPDRDITRAGVLVYHCPHNRMEAVEMLFATPAAKPGFTPPKDQIAKGGRQVRTPSGYRDLDNRNDANGYHSTDLEPLLRNALREGIEELGLRLANISDLHDAGAVIFTSEKTGRQTPMQLYLVRVADKQAFDAVDPTHAARVRWLTPEAFEAEGREDHKPIVRESLARLRRERTNGKAL